MKSYNYYPTAKLELNGKTLKLEPYRVAEVREYVMPLEQIQSQLGTMMAKVGVYKKRAIDADTLTIEEIDELAELNEKALILKVDAMDLAYNLAQLGLKRAMYPEAKDLIGSELDKFDDVGVSEGEVTKTTSLMFELANRNVPKVDGTKKGLKKALNKSGKGSKNGS